MKWMIMSVLFVILSTAGSDAQTFGKNSTVGGVMMDNADRKRGILIGMSRALSEKYPNLKFSEFSKCLEDAADFPINWDKDIGPFAKTCAEKFAGR